MKTKKHWFTTSSGRIEFQLTLEQAEKGYHSGACDSGIAELLTDPGIAATLAALDPALLAEELEEYGAWEADELANHADNIARLLWTACGDIVENAFMEGEL